MENTELNQVCYELASSLEIILGLGKQEVLWTVLEGFGYTEDYLKDIAEYLEEITSADEFNKNVEKQAFVTYVDNIEKLAKDMKIAKMAQGYQDMGDINLAISDENLHLEEEGEKANEVVREKEESGNEAI